MRERSFRILPRARQPAQIRPARLARVKALGLRETVVCLRKKIMDAQNHCEASPGTARTRRLTNDVPRLFNRFRHRRVASLQLNNWHRWGCGAVPEIKPAAQ